MKGLVTDGCVTGFLTYVMMRDVVGSDEITCVEALAQAGLMSRSAPATCWGSVRDGTLASVSWAVPWQCAQAKGEQFLPLPACFPN